MIQKLLKNNNLKITKNRVDIIKILEEENPLSAENIYDRLDKKTTNLSSIYRNLSVFVEHNIVIKSVGMDNIAYYQLNNENHKHQLICYSCNKSISIDFCPIHELENSIENKTGFKIKSHNFEFRGICPECNEKTNLNKQNL